MRLTGYEIKKLMTQIPLWIAFIGLFVGNLFLLFMIQKKEAAYVYVYQQKDQYIAFCEGNEQADELGFYEADLEEQKIRTDRAKRARDQEIGDTDNQDENIRDFLKAMRPTQEDLDNLFAGEVEVDEDAEGTEEASEV